MKRTTIAIPQLQPCPKVGTPEYEAHLRSLRFARCPFCRGAYEARFLEWHETICDRRPL